jgi:hydrogenase large subunit
MTWRGRIFEVGAYARIYLSALAGKLPASRYLESTNGRLVLHLPADKLPVMDAVWAAPSVWNAFERNRARAYAVAYNLLVMTENYHRAKRMLRDGASSMAGPFEIPERGELRGAGFCGAGRGFLAHWAVVRDGAIANYQIAVPSRINAGPRAPWGELGACERAVKNTPIVESNFKGDADFAGIDILRTIQSFDPCMPCTAQMQMVGNGRVLERVVATTGP